MDIDTIYEENYGYVLVYVKRFLHSAQDAEDVTQETFLRLVRHINNGGEVPREPRAWLTTVSGRIAIDHIRKRRELPEEWEDTMRDEFDFAEVSDRIVDSDAISETLVRAINALSPGQREVFVLRYYYDYPVKDVAAMTGRTRDAVRVMAARAKKRLAALLVMQR